jgi:hypothetical protein
MVDRSQPSRLIDSPKPCFVRMQVVQHGPFVGARIFNRLGMLTAEINGKPADPFQVWHAGDLITEEQYQILMEEPEPNPYRRVHVTDAGLADRIREANENDYWFMREIR